MVCMSTQGTFPFVAAVVPPAGTPYPAHLHGGVPPHNREETSRSAAESVIPTANRGLWIVLRYVATRRDGATRDEIECDTGLRIPVVCARVDDLLERGAVEELGGTRRTRSGRPAKVVTLTAEGRRALATEAQR